MGKTLKRSLIVGIIFLFLSTVCLPVLASEELPDLVINDIFLWPSDTPHEYHFECSIINQGNPTNEWNDIEINVKIKWMFLGKIPLLTIASNTGSNHLQGIIGTGERINLSFASCDRLPKFGSYRFILEVNPNETVDESNYDNNKYSEDWKVFLRDWKEI